jgi:hypothetical protein
MSAVRGRSMPDRAVALVVALVAVAAFAGTFGFDSVPEGLAQGLGAVEFPRLVCLVLLGLAVLLALGALPEAPPAPVPATGWASFALCAAFLPMLLVIGMLPAMLVFLIAMGWLWGERRRGLLLGSAVGLVAGIWIVFVRLFALTLPQGWIGDRIPF